MSTRLQMIFNTAGGSRRTVSLADPRADLTDMDVQAAMDTIITKNVFESNGEDFVSIYGARIVTTETAELNVS